MNAEIERYLKTAEFLSEALPENYEISLFDLTAKGMPVVASFNAKKSNEDEVRRFLRTVLKNVTIIENGMLLNRSESSTKTRLSKHSVLFIKDESGAPVGALVILIELSNLITASALINDILSFNHTDIENIQPRDDKPKKDAPSLEMIERMAYEFSETPARLTMDERTELLTDMYDEYVFSVKGSVAKAAEVLGMSEQSVYRYISNIKKMRGE
ncbi:MAG: helix-turn-helix domain-containing protein [Clostridia bacterium]|nr:helix-turn-helix domain-containing protein [Clostridia bacterium]